MRLFILWYLMLATSVLADGPVLYRDTTTKVTSRTNATYETATGDIDMGGDDLKGLPTTPPTDTSAAAKIWVQSQTGVTQESLTLTGASDTITPANASDIINVQPAVSAPAAKYSFYHRFNSETPDVCNTSDCTVIDTTGTPVISGGSLDLTGGSPTATAQALSYRRFDGGGTNMGSVNNSTLRYFGWRMNFRPNWSGAAPPDCPGTAFSGATLFSMDNGGTTNTSDSNRAILYVSDVGGILSYKMYSSSNSNQVNLWHDPAVGDDYWVAGKVYEVEFNCEWNNPGRCELYVDGHRASSVPVDTSLLGFWLSNNTTMRVTFGGEGGINYGSSGNTDLSPGCSNHWIDDFVWYYDNTATGTDVREHNTDISYAPTYLPPGDTTGFETITKLTSTGYEEGDLVTLVSASDGQNWELIPSSAGVPATDELALRSKFSPKYKGDRVLLQKSGAGYWVEVARHYEDPANGGPGSDDVILTAASDTITTLGGDEVSVSGSVTALSADVAYKVDFTNGGLAADYAAGQNSNFDPDPPYSRYTAEATPSVVGGELNMNTAGEQRSAWYWRGDGANLDLSSNNAGAVRVLWTPNYSGTPTEHIGIFTSNGSAGSNECRLDIGTNTSCRHNVRIVHGGSVPAFGTGEIGFYIWNEASTRYQLLSSGFSAVAGTTYEIEANWDFDAGNAYLFIDGVLEASVALAGAWNSTTGPGFAHQSFILGGMDNTLGAGIPSNQHDGDQGNGLSNHKYDGFAVFNNIQHTVGYSPTGLPGASGAFDTITKMTTASTYREGQVVTLRVGEANRFSITDNASPAADQFALNGNWAPTSTDEMLIVRRTGNYWTEVGRFPAPAGALAAHDLGGAEHNADSLADLNTKVSDATLVDGIYIPRIQDATPETATFTAVIGETHIVDLSGGSFTANLPPVASGAGQIRFHVNGTAGQLTVDGNASELIDGKLTLKIRSGTTTITNDGTEWHILQRTARSPNRVDPAQITADQDPYNPPDWDNTVTHLYIDSDATRTLQGFAEGNFVEMDEVIVVNDGANDIVIAHDNATVASNSVLVDGSANFTLGPNKVAVLIRDGTVNKWRLYAMVTPLFLETSVQVMAASAAVSSTADRVRLDGNSATVTATLFNCDVTSNGSKVRFVAVDVTNPLSVAADAGDTIIGGAPTFTAVGDSATLICYGAGAEWEVY